MADGYEASQGADAAETLGARMGLAVAMKNTGDVAGARVMYEDLLPRRIAAEGEGSDGVLVLQGNLVALLCLTPVGLNALAATATRTGTTRPPASPSGGVMVEAR